jgi:hypothetical protein
MNEPLDIEQLEQKYPLCFKHPGTCMWGVDCQSGWNQLLHDLLGKLEAYLSANQDKFINCEFPFRIDQIKEKFGTLRFYVGGEIDDTMWQYIDCAERESAHVCEVCGKPGSLHSAKRGFWVKTLCTDCAKDRYIPYDRNMMP